MVAGARESWLGNPPPSLLIVNYHRLLPARNGARLDFDDGVFGPDVTEFRRQMEWLRSHTTILSEEGRLATLVGCSMTTAHFIRPSLSTTHTSTATRSPDRCSTTSNQGHFLRSNRHDRFAAAGMVGPRSIRSETTRHASVHVANEVLGLRRDFRGSLRRVLEMFKLRPADETDDLLETLVVACEVALPGKDVQSGQLMTWEQMREMRESGHSIGSHTFSHRVLATLPVDTQAHEIKDSRRELEARIGGPRSLPGVPRGGAEAHQCPQRRPRPRGRIRTGVYL